MIRTRHECRASGALSGSHGVVAGTCGHWHARCLIFFMACLYVIASGCVLPPPIDEATPSENRAPTIDPILPSPPDQPVTLSCTGATQIFLANIADEDTNDTLYWRMFVDYYAAAPADLLAVEATRAPPLRPPNERRASKEIGINDPTLQAHPTDGHVIELFVADRPFDDTATDVDPSAIAKTPVTGGLTASYQWFIDPIGCP